MASGLSLVIKVTAGQGEHVAKALHKAFSHTTTSPQILHYVWAVAVPQISSDTVLLTTVYDEQFDAYIRDLVLADPAPFNAAAAHIVGLEKMVPVEKNLTAFVQFVLDNDLTKAGKALLGSFFEAYPYTVAYIKAHGN